MVIRGGTLQINWHDTKPILTLDFHPLSGILAAGGADYDIKDNKLFLALMKSSVEGEQKKSPIREPEDMKVEETTQAVTGSADCREEAERKDPKSNVTSSSTSTPKPAKWRITPMSIDQY